MITYHIYITYIYIYIYHLYIYHIYIHMVCAVAIVVKSSFLLISLLCGIQSTNWTLKTSSLQTESRSLQTEPVRKWGPTYILL